MDTILQIQKDTFVQIEIKKSKFLCFSFCLQSKEQAEDIVKDLNKKYCDATHVCYAYVVNGQEKACDDGEPQGTAGKPILDCIKRKDLKNVLVAVVRYFGGIKLGAGGLIRAYSNGAKEVLELSGTKEQIACKKIVFETEFQNQKKLSQLLKNSMVLKHEIEYQQNIVTTVYVLSQDINEFSKILNDCFSQQMMIKTDDNIYFI